MCRKSENASEIPLLIDISPGTGIFRVSHFVSGTEALGILHIFPPTQPPTPVVTVLSVRRKAVHIHKPLHKKNEDALMQGSHQDCINVQDEVVDYKGWVGQD